MKFGIWSIILDDCLDVRLDYVWQFKSELVRRLEGLVFKKKKFHSNEREIEREREREREREKERERESEREREVYLT